MYREILPIDVEEMIREAESEGQPMSADDIEYEKRKANHWATIGIGIEGYYN